MYLIVLKVYVSMYVLSFLLRGDAKNRRFMKRQKLFRAPKLNDRGGDISKPWWVEIGYRDPRTGRMERKRYQKEISLLKTKKSRYEMADKLSKELLAKLNRGWIPPDDTAEQVVYVDQLEYHQAAQTYGRRRKANKNIRFYASEYITLIKSSKAKKTFESYRGKIRELIAWLEKNRLVDNDISTFDGNIFQQFFDHLIIERELAGQTVEKYHIQIMKFMRYLVERKAISVIPEFTVEYPETDEDYSALPFSDDDLEIILRAIEGEDPQLYLAALLQFYCFIRPGDELLTLRVRQLNFTSRTIFIPKNIAKKRTARTVDIPNQMYRLLIENGINRINSELFVIGPFGRPGTRSIGYNTLRERFNRFRDRLGLNKNYKWYSFKHTGAGKLLESGATIIELMNQLGHTNMESTYRYIRRHFGERSEHVRTRFPDAPGLKKQEKIVVNWLDGICFN